ncbi:MAG: pyridoxal kinase PdxY [Propionibacteriaceae bacterium]|jgi:pyridoxine kinase|nr:pyridoxal kinase PdxY [Propionibacteriaceae bacterium]
MDYPQILSIQSAVSYGFAGNSAAVFPLRRAGIDVWPVYTVNFSNHTGYGAWRGIHIAASDVSDIVTGIDERGALTHVDAVLSGYQGSADMGEAIVAAVELVKQRNPAARYCADPVFGDVGRGVYAAAGIPEMMRDLVTPRADIMTPNLFELQYLTGRPTNTLADIVAAAAALRELGPETVLVTSAQETGERPDFVRMIALDSTGCWQVETPLIDRTFAGSGFVGSGDLTAAMFLAQLLRGATLGDALSATASIVYSVLKITDDLGGVELRLVQAQDSITDPVYRFTAQPLA